MYLLFIGEGVDFVDDDGYIMMETGEDVTVRSDAAGYANLSDMNGKLTL